MSVRMLFCSVRPFFCRIGLLALHLRHLTNRMFLARSGKQSHGKENGEDALANKRSHNALAQLSVSCQACKAKARYVGQASCLWDGGLPACRSFQSRRRSAQAQCLCYCCRILRLSARARVGLRGSGRGRGRVMIETRRCRITITRGGPHRKTQRMERSIRSRSAFRRHVAVFRADFVHAERYTGVALV
jgi:hypothetical protein